LATLLKRRYIFELQRRKTSPGRGGWCMGSTRCTTDDMLVVGRLQGSEGGGGMICSSF